MNVGVEEGDMPTAPEPMPTEDDKTTLVKMATLWVKIDGLFERMQKIYVDWKAKMDAAEVAPRPQHAFMGPRVSNRNVNVNRFSLPKDPREIVVAAMLALSIMVNLWCGWIIRDVGTRKWLHDYDLNQFQMHEFAQLKGEVDVDHELIKVFGPQQCKRTP